MSWLYRVFLRPLLFQQDPEAVHEFVIRRLGSLSKNPLLCEAMGDFLQAPPLPVQAFGLDFPNPVGLAAGLDKDAAAVPAWAAMGFGFSELGAVTRHAQPGNPAPRLFRAVAEKAIVNRMGFNNVGAEQFAQRLAAWREAGRWPRHPVGINLGKSKIVPLEEAAGDYVFTFRVLWPLADFFVVNVSSPNTPNLRQLQDKAALDEILAALQEANHSLARQQATSSLGAGTGSSSSNGPKPILVKVAPDLSFTALDEILELVAPRQLAGLVATNTTIARPDTDDPVARRAYAEAGGLSGKPLRARSTEVIRHLYRQTKGKVPIIGVGGIFNAADAWEKITAGATLLQVYTGFIYEGPDLARSIVAGLRARLAEAGFHDLQEAVGAAAGGCASA